MASGVRKGTRTQTQTLIQPQVIDTSRRASVEAGNPITEILKEIRSLKTEMRKEMKETRVEMKADFRKELDCIVQRIDNMSKDMNMMKNDIQEIQDRTKKLEREKESLTENQRQEEMKINQQELRYRDKCIKMRGIEESAGEHLEENVITALANYIGVKEEEMEREIDRVFRVNSRTAREKNWPRDVIVCFLRTRVKEKVLQTNYNKQLVLEGRTIRIYKDIPFEILKRRQDYRFLTQFLQKHGIQYKWERLEGLSYTFKQRRYKITNVTRAREMFEKLRRELEEAVVREGQRCLEKTGGGQEEGLEMGKGEQASGGEEREKKEENRSYSESDIEQEEEIEQPKEELEIEDLYVEEEDI